MSRRITTTIIAIVVATLVLLGTSTFLVARAALRRQTLTRLEHQVTEVAALLPNVSAGGALVPTTAAPSTTTATTAPPTTAPLSPRAARIAARRQAIADARAAAQGRLAGELSRRLSKTLDISGITQVDIAADGTVTGELPVPLQPADLDTAALRNGEVVSGRHGNLLFAAAARANVRNGTGLAAFVLTDNQEGLFGPTWRWFVIFGALSVAMGAVAAVLLGRRLARPVLAAADTTARLATGDLSARIPVDERHDDELRTLALSINSMADGLQRARDQEQSFLMSVSHDLRTPLTSIRGYAEAIADGATDNPTAAAEVILGESRRLERLVGDLLDLAKLDARRFTLHPTVADLGRLVERAVDAHGPDAAERGVTLRAEIAPGVAANASVDVDRVAQVLGNLTTNAVEFARSEVVLRVHRDGDGVVVDVVDDGPGIGAADLPHVFDRLYRADNQPDRRSGGSGLGLAIVHELVAALGGRVGVQSVPGSGTRFWVRFPAA